MRIVHPLPALVAVLLHLVIVLLISTVHCRLNNSTFTSDKLRHSHSYNLEWSPHLSIREKQSYLRREFADAAVGAPGDLVGVSCCPTLLEMVEPEAGTDERGMYVKLYRGDGDVANRQRFYEVSCAPGVEAKPCRFIDRRLYAQSRCVQQFSYSYAIVRRDDGLGAGANASNFPQIGTGWMLGYIKVRSGCDCVLTPKKDPTRSKKKPRNRKHHSTSHQQTPAKQSKTQEQAEQQDTDDSEVLQT